MFLRRTQYVTQNYTKTHEKVTQNWKVSDFDTRTPQNLRETSFVSFLNCSRVPSIKSSAIEEEQFPIHDRY